MDENSAALSLDVTDCTHCFKRVQRTVLVREEDIRKEEQSLGEACFLSLEGTEGWRLIGATPFHLGQR